MLNQGAASTHPSAESRVHALESSQVVHVASELGQGSTVANDDAGAPDDDRRVRPLWMITAFLGAYFAAIAAALMLG